MHILVVEDDVMLQQVLYRGLCTDSMHWHAISKYTAQYPKRMVRNQRPQHRVRELG